MIGRFQQFVARLRAIFQKRTLDADFECELAHHFDALVEENIGKGMTQPEARRQANITLGGREQVRELHREARGVAWLEDTWRDSAHCIRSLHRAPAFTVAVLTTLILCIGPNTAISTALYALVLKHPPFAEPDKLVNVFNEYTKVGGSTTRQQSSPGQYLDFKANANLFDGFAIMEHSGFTIGEDAGPERLNGLDVSADLFSVLGVKPLLGRFPTAEEQTSGKDHVVVLTQRYWHTKYRDDLTVIGKAALINDEPWTIIGVAPACLELLDGYAQVLHPMVLPDYAIKPEARYYQGKSALIGRLKPGVTLSGGLAQLSTIEQRYFEQQAPPSLRSGLEKSGHRILLSPTLEELSAKVKKPLWFLQAGSLFVLLIGIVNVTNLLLARANARRTELAIRHALGASRGALRRLFLLETALLMGTAMAGGSVLAWGILKLFNRYLPQVMPSAAPVSLDLSVLGFILMSLVTAASITAVFVFGLLWRTGLDQVQTRTGSANRTVRRVGNLLVVAQVGTALVLLATAGLLIRSYAKVLEVDIGFDASRVLEARTVLPKTYSDSAKVRDARHRIVAAVKEIPGVDSAACVAHFAVAESGTPTVFTLRNLPLETEKNHPLVNFEGVSPGYFATMGIRLIEGHDFTEADEVNFGESVIVDEAFQKRYFPGKSALGEEIVLNSKAPTDDKKWGRIIGVVKRANITGLEQRDGLPIIYIGFWGQGGGLTVVARSDRPTSDLLAEIRAKFRTIDPSLTFYHSGSLQSALEDMLIYRRGIMLLLAMFAGLALLLAGVGLYGVLAYDVSQRTREIGIRGAIGATSRQIVGLVLRQGLLDVGIGLLLGSLGIVATSRFVKAQLFDVKPIDPITHASVLILLGVAALLACWLPARKAAKVNPAIALRAE